MSFIVDDTKPYLCISYAGQVDDDLVLACLEEIIRSKGYGSKDQLVDYTAVTAYKVTIPGLKRVTDRINEHIEQRGNLERKSNAYVVPEDIEYGMGRIFLAYIKESDTNQLFRSRAQAIAWLGVGDEDDLPHVC